MMRFLWCFLAAGLLAAPPGPMPAADKDPPPAIEGRWESPARGSGKGDMRMQSLEFKSGRMVWVEPRLANDKSKRTGFRLEAEYTVSKSGRVYGLVTLAGGSIKADEGDTFSFLPKLTEGVFTMEDIRGTAALEMLADGVRFKPAP